MPTRLRPLPPEITDVCREFYGRVAVMRGRRQLVDNRCDSCTLRAPCLKSGSSPAPTYEHLNRNRATFIAEAMEILGVAGG